MQGRGRSDGTDVGTGLRLQGPRGNTAMIKDFISRGSRKAQAYASLIRRAAAHIDALASDDTSLTHTPVAQPPPEASFTIPKFWEPNFWEPSVQIALRD